MARPGSNPDNNNNYQYLTTLPRQSKFLSVFFVHTYTFNFIVHVMCSASSNVLVGIILPVFFKGYGCNVAQNYSVEFKGKKTLPMYENQDFYGLM